MSTAHGDNLTSVFLIYLSISFLFLLPCIRLEVLHRVRKERMDRILFPDYREDSFLSLLQCYAGYHLCIVLIMPQNDLPVPSFIRALTVQ